MSQRDSASRLRVTDRQSFAYAAAAALMLEIPKACEQVLHVDAQGLVVAVDGSPGCGFAAESRAADAGDNGCDDVLSQGE